MRGRSSRCYNSSNSIQMRRNDLFMFSDAIERKTGTSMIRKVGDDNLSMMLALCMQMPRVSQVSYLDRKMEKYFFIAFRYMKGALERGLVFAFEESLSMKSWRHFWFGSWTRLHGYQRISKRLKSLPWRFSFHQMLMSFTQSPCFNSPRSNFSIIKFRALKDATDFGIFHLSFFTNQEFFDPFKSSALRQERLAQKL